MEQTAIEKMIDWLNDHPTMDMMTKSNAIRVAQIFMEQEEIQEIPFPFKTKNEC